MADTHFSTRLGNWLQLERSEANNKGHGWLDVVPKRLAGDKVGYHVKMRKDPNNSKAQDFVAGKALGTPREAAIRRAEWVAEHPFPPKDAGRKVRLLMCPFLFPFSPRADSCLADQAQAEGRGQGGGASLNSAGLGSGPQPREPMERRLRGGHDPGGGPPHSGCAGAGQEVVPVGRAAGGRAGTGDGAGGGAAAAAAAVAAARADSRRNCFCFAAACRSSSTHPICGCAVRPGDAG